jgi:putative membrane protein
MILRLLFAGLHLLALGIGLGSVWVRRRALVGTLDAAGLRRVLAGDAWWGVAGALWLVTGAVRMMTTMEKGSAYYLSNHVFLTKMGLFLLIVVLEVRAVRTLGGWRKALRRGEVADTSAAGTLARISGIQAALVVVMVFLAVTMARGLG